MTGAGALLLRWLTLEVGESVQEVSVPGQANISKELCEHPCNMVTGFPQSESYKRARRVAVSFLLVTEVSPKSERKETTLSVHYYQHARG